MKGKRVHFIAIGGSAMHNLAIALHLMGCRVTGSDDEIFEPSKSRLQSNGLLPQDIGWEAGRITPEIELVVLGMHARLDNPELVRAQELGLKIVSYPELIYEFSQNKQRIVIAGSHGKTTITSMIMHVLKASELDFDYLVGASVKGFENSVRLTEQAPVIVIEGDEYLASPIDRQPKFLKYHHHIGIISGIAWDHINVFPSFNQYMRQFEHFADQSPKGGVLIYNGEDDIVSVICKKERDDVQAIEYGVHPHRLENAKILLQDGENETGVPFFGEHNLMNVAAAKAVCDQLQVPNEVFYQAISTFEGAANRLQVLHRSDGQMVYKDFAHAPSKVKATTEAVRHLQTGRKLAALLELHTFSSLNKAFIDQYAGTLDAADAAIVYFNPHVIEHKKLENLNTEEVHKAFGEGKSHIKVTTNAEDARSFFRDNFTHGADVLVMSSGTFDGIDFAAELKTLAHANA